MPDNTGRMTGSELARRDEFRRALMVRLVPAIAGAEVRAQSRLQSVDDIHVVGLAAKLTQGALEYVEDELRDDLRKDAEAR